MQEAYRIFKKGGLLIVTVNNKLLFCKSYELKEGDFGLFRKNMKTSNRYIVWGGQEKSHISHEFTIGELKNALEKNHFTIKKLLSIFNLMNKYEIDNVNNKKEFIKLQIKFAEKDECIDNSQDFFFVAEK